MVTKKVMFSKKAPKQKDFAMRTYTVERVDISRATVEACSLEEALDIANSDPSLWDIDVGTPEAFEQD